MPVKSAPDKVYGFVRSLIEKGELVSGDAIPSERYLQDELRVSRFAVREGITKLDALGIVTRSQGRATVISKSLDASRLSDFFLPVYSQANREAVQDLVGARVAIERETVRQATRRRTANDVKRLHNVLELTEGHLGDAKYFAELDYEFHLEIARVSGNAILTSVLEALHDQIRRFIDRSLEATGQRQEALQWHRDILRHISDGDPEKAEARLVLHLADCEVAYRRTDEPSECATP